MTVAAPRLRRALVTITSLLTVGCFAPSAESVIPDPPAATGGIHVRNGLVLEANNNVLVMRGINHGHNWFPAETQQAFSDMKATGANTVRVVLSAGRFVRSTPADVAVVVVRCRQLKLICVLENHDTTSYGDDPAATSLDQAADFWISLKNVLMGEEPYIIINIGNEPFGTKLRSQWTKATIAAVKKLRNAGFHHALMVDAPDFGQDESFTMRDNAPAVLRADPDHNVIFDIHMYHLYGKAAAVASYIDSFVRRRLPLVVGEFSWKAPYGDVNEGAILSHAQRRKVGWLAWSWSGNTEPVYFDMVHKFNAARRTTYGETVIIGRNGLFSTSKEATVYRGMP